MFPSCFSRCDAVCRWSWCFLHKNEIDSLTSVLCCFIFTLPKSLMFLSWMLTQEVLAMRLRQWIPQRMYHSLLLRPWVAQNSPWHMWQGGCQVCSQYLWRTLLAANPKNSCCPIELFGLLEGSCWAESLLCSHVTEDWTQSGETDKKLSILHQMKCSLTMSKCQK